MNCWSELPCVRPLDAALDDAAITAGQVDRVFLTGGSSLVPAVRRIFETRFGEARVVAGGEFVSVAEGLALMGQEWSDPD